MTKAEIRSKFDEIVTFAEVERFLDTPVKHYSSGMYVRLAFGVAAHLEPEILVIDEVLAVGDVAFQKKCLGKISDVARDGRTILFVSHNLAAVKNLCTRALVLSAGCLVHDGDVDGAVGYYSGQAALERRSVWQRPPQMARRERFISTFSTELLGEQPNHVLECEIDIKSSPGAAPVFLAIDIADASGIAIMQAIPRVEPFIKGEYDRLRVTVHLPPLIPGVYMVHVWIGPHNTETVEWIKEATNFEILYSPSPGRTYPHAISNGHVFPQSECQFLAADDQGQVGVETAAGERGA
jgi:lipopolysaccharide transport system ATP-binding protein